MLAVWAIDAASESLPGLFDLLVAGGVYEKSVGMSIIIGPDLMVASPSKTVASVHNLGVIFARNTRQPKS